MDDPSNARRSELLLAVTKRLIIMTSAALVAWLLIFVPALYFQQRFMLTHACFVCGLLGGFVSIQQRLRTLDNQELELLSRSWFQILLIPVYGGLFAMVFYAMILSGTIAGSLFPVMAMPQFSSPLPTTQDIVAFFLKTYPATGPDVAKLFLWSFVAGFSERLVPQVIGKMHDDSGLPPDKKDE